MTKGQKKEIINKNLQLINISKDIYLPSNPYYQVQSIIQNSGLPMQSAARVPIMVSFECVGFEGPDEYLQNKIVNQPSNANNEFTSEIESI